MELSTFSFKPSAIHTAVNASRSREYVEPTAKFSAYPLGGIKTSL